MKRLILRSIILNALGLWLWIGAVQAQSSVIRQQVNDAFGLYESRLSDTNWGLYENGNVFCWVQPQTGAFVRLKWKAQSRNTSRWADAAFIEGARGRQAEGYLPQRCGPHYSFVQAEWHWAQGRYRIRSASRDGSLILEVEPLQVPDTTITLFVEAGFLWNKPGQTRLIPGGLECLPEGKSPIRIQITGAEVEDRVSHCSYPFQAYRLRKGQGIRLEIGNSPWKSLDEAEQAYLGSLGPNPALKQALQAALGFNLIYEPVKSRQVLTVNRQWNENRGGYVFFGWDNFFLARMAGYVDKNLAWAALLAHLQDRTPEGFIPNNSQGNGRQSLDRSQPPVGGLMTRELYAQHPEREALEGAFPALYEWNRWWLKQRQYQGLLCWGSHKSPNPFRDPAWHNRLAAILECGLDDTPLYNGIPFDTTLGLLLVHDVGLNSLYAADCQALAELAGILGKKAEQQELLKTARLWKKNLERLYEPKKGIYLNRQPSGTWVDDLNPTVFYPWLAGEVPPAVSRKMLGYLQDTAWFGGPWVIPSVPRNHPEFHKQRYWRGSIWAPLNYLVWLGMRQQSAPEVIAARRELVAKSTRMFVQEYEQKGYISENYSSLDGTGDHPSLKSERFYAWGALLALMGLQEP